MYRRASHQNIISNEKWAVFAQQEFDMDKMLEDFSKSGDTGDKFNEFIINYYYQLRKLGNTAFEALEAMRQSLEKKGNIAEDYIDNLKKIAFLMDAFEMNLSLSGLCINYAAEDNIEAHIDAMISIAIRINERSQSFSADALLDIMTCTFIENLKSRSGKAYFCQKILFIWESISRLMDNSEIGNLLGDIDNKEMTGELGYLFATAISIVPVIISVINKDSHPQMEKLRYLDPLCFEGYIKYRFKNNIRNIQDNNKKLSYFISTLNNLIVAKEKKKKMPYLISSDLIESAFEKYMLIVYPNQQITEQSIADLTLLALEMGKEIKHEKYKLSFMKELVQDFKININKMQIKNDEKITLFYKLVAQLIEARARHGKRLDEITIHALQTFEKLVLSGSSEGLSLANRFKLIDNIADSLTKYSLISASKNYQRYMENIKEKIYWKAEQVEKNYKQLVLADGRFNRIYESLDFLKLNQSKIVKEAKTYFDTDVVASGKTVWYFEKIAQELGQLKQSSAINDYTEVQRMSIDEIINSCNSTCGEIFAIDPAVSEVQPTSSAFFKFR